MLGQRCCKILGFLIGFSSLPLQVWSAPNPEIRTALGYLFLPDPGPGGTPPHGGRIVDDAPLEASRSNRLPADLPPAEDHRLVTRVPPPLPGSAPNYADASILGITIYAPFFVPTFFGLRMPNNMCLEDVLAAVRAVGHMPSRDLDVIVPISRQRFDCSLGLLAFPSSLLQTLPAMCPVILDLTRVGGHYHADSIPCNLKRQEFTEHIATLIWYLEDEIEIWVDASELPASHGTLAYAPGSVFTVVLRGIGPMRTYTVSDVLSPQANWGPFEHSPSPRTSMGSAIVDTREAAYLSVSMLSPLWPDTDVRRALKLAPTDGILPTEFHVRLDVHGKHCHTVFAGPADQSPWLLDFRPLGFQMRVTYSQLEPDLKTIIAALGDVDLGHQSIRVHKVPTKAKTSVYLPCLVIRPDLGETSDRQDAACVPTDLLPEQTRFVASWDEDFPEVGERQDFLPQVSLKGPSEATPNLQLAVDNVVAAGDAALLPAPFHRIGDIPPEHPQHQAAVIDGEDESEVVLDVVFLLFSQDMTPEHIRLSLTMPCSLDDVLLALADACDPGRYVLFPEHTPARPQPSQWWIAIIAQPAWALHEPTILLNPSSVDGRCFVASAPHFFSRGQILRLAGLIDDGTFEVFPFLAHEPMTADDVIRLVPCGTVTVNRAGGRRVVQGHLIENMLLGQTMWDANPDLPSPPLGERSLLIHGHGSGVIHPRSGTGPPTSDEVAALCGARSDTIRLTSASLAAQDVLSQGYICQHLFGVSFMEDNLLAAGEAHEYVAFVDCRALLQGWSMETSTDGRLSHAEMTNWMDTFAPPNWQPQIEGAPIEDGFLVVPHGAVLTASYVPVSSPECQCGSDVEHDAAEDEEDDSDSSGPASSSPGRESPPTAEQQAHPTGPSAGSRVPSSRTTSRSRSRGSRGRTPANFAVHPTCPPAAGVFLLRAMYAPVATACAVPRACSDGSFSSLGGFRTPEPSFRDSRVAIVLFCLMGSALLCWILFRSRYCASHLFASLRDHKISAEPTTCTDTDQARLDALRSVTRRLGGQWPVPLRPLDPDEFPLDPDEDEESEGLMLGQAVSVQVSCVVLKFDFMPEVINVSLSVPCTNAEALSLTQHARDPYIRTAFPLLTAVTPQPLPGHIVCIGVPAWDLGCCICIDARAIDRRLFVAYAPAYALRRDLLFLADIPGVIELDVWIAGDEVPLAEDVFAHLRPGTLVSFLPREARPVDVPPLGQLLLSLRWWDDTGDFPTPHIDRAYCLVIGSQARLYVADYSVPTRFRQEIAAIAGVSCAGMRLSPAHPRPLNVSLQGVPCRTVVAVGEISLTPQSGSSEQVLVDCRQLAEGWKAIVALNGRLDVAGLLHDLEDLRPRGWRFRTVPAAGDDGYLSVIPGQVIVLSLAMAPQHLPNNASGSSSSPPARENAPTEPEVQGTGDEEVSDSNPADGSEPTPDPDGGDNEPADEGTPGLATLQFAVFTPEYTPEFLSIPAHLPAPIPRILIMIARARDPARHQLFPRLLPVRVQPALPFACVIALPDWDFEGVPVLIACDLPRFRVFADILPAFLVREAALRIAELDETTNAEVFLSDIPWAFQGMSRLYLAAGDLIRICSNDHPVVPPIEFIGYCLIDGRSVS